MLLIVTLVLIHAYMKPSVDYNAESDKYFIHYWWRGARRTYIL